MHIEFQRKTLNFDPTRNQEQSEEETFVFEYLLVETAEVAISGFDIQFTDADRSFFRQKVYAKVVEIKRSTVRVRFDYLLRDKSGDIDDAYESSVDVLVIAKVKYHDE